MALGVLGLFGDVFFTCSSSQVKTFKDLQVQRSARFAKHDLIGQKPVLEKIGPDLPTVTFTIQLRSQFNSSPVIYMPILRRMIDDCEAYKLILGPDYFGKYVIEGLSEDRKYHNRYGACIAADISLSLRAAEEASTLGIASDLLGGLGDIVDMTSGLIDRATDSVGDFLGELI